MQHKLLEIYTNQELSGAVVFILATKATHAQVVADTLATFSVTPGELIALLRGTCLTLEHATIWEAHTKTKEPTL